VTRQFVLTALVSRTRA